MSRIHECIAATITIVTNEIKWMHECSLVRKLKTNKKKNEKFKYTQIMYKKNCMLIQIENKIKESEYKLRLQMKTIIF